MMPSQALYAPKMPAKALAAMSGHAESTPVLIEDPPIPKPIDAEEHPWS
jgi:hypothetical protein